MFPVSITSANIPSFLLLASIFYTPSRHYFANVCATVGHISLNFCTNKALHLYLLPSTSHFRLIWRGLAISGTSLAPPTFTFRATFASTMHHRRGIQEHVHVRAHADATFDSDHSGHTYKLFVLPQECVYIAGAGERASIYFYIKYI